MGDLPIYLLLRKNTSAVDDNGSWELGFGEDVCEQSFPYVITYYIKRVKEVAEGSLREVLRILNTN